MTDTVPPFGTEITYPGGKAVFAELVRLPDNSLAFDCQDCVFEEKCPRIDGKTALDCRGGVYLDKTKYLGLKLVGVIK